MNAVGVKCIFCGFCLSESELSGHLSGYHSIKSLLLRPNQSSAGTQIDKEDRYFIYGQKKYLCDEDPEPPVSPVEVETTSADKIPSGVSESSLQKPSAVETIAIDTESLIETPSAAKTPSEVTESPLQTPSSPETSPGETESSFDAEEHHCSRFRCPACSFINHSYSRVREHIATKHRNSRLSRRRNQPKFKPKRQEMSLKLKGIYLPEYMKLNYNSNTQESLLLTSNINQKENVDPQEPVEELKRTRKRGRPRRKELKSEVSEELTRRTRSSLPTIETDKVPLQKRKTRHSLSRIEIGIRQPRQTRKSPVEKRSGLKKSKSSEEKNDSFQDFSLVNEEPEHEQFLPAPVCDDEDIVNVLDKLIQEAEEESVVTVDESESGPHHDNTLEELDCIILEEVSSLASPQQPLSDIEQQELKFILETSSPTVCHPATPGTFTRPVTSPTADPGPSRPYQCPHCPSKYDTALEVYNHVAVCTASVRLSDDDTSSLSTGVSATPRPPSVDLTSTPSRNIKTDNVSDIKSSVTNVYIRFVQTYYSNYKRKFPHLNSADLMEKLLEGYKVMRAISHPCIKTLQEEYEKERRELYSRKIRTIVRSLEEEDSASFSPIKYKY